jgi:hypothetical protein
VEFNKATHYVEYDRYGAVAAIKAEAIAELEPFYAASLEFRTRSPGLLHACTSTGLIKGGQATNEGGNSRQCSKELPKGGQVTIESLNDLEIIDITAKDATNTPINTSRHQQTGGPDGVQDLSLDEEEPEDTLGQERRDSFAPTFRNDGDSFHCFLNCMLYALFAVPQFLKALQRSISATTGH